MSFYSSKVMLPLILSEKKRRYAFISEDEREYFEERAAIMEFDGGLERAAAEEQAWVLILKQRTMYAKTG